MAEESGETEPYAAGEVEVGWVVRYAGADREVLDKRVQRPRDGEIDRRVTLWLEGHTGGGVAGGVAGDEGQTVHVVVGADGKPVVRDAG